MTKWFALSTLCFSCQLAFSEVDIETIIPDFLITCTYQDIPVTITGLDVGKRYHV